MPAILCVGLWVSWIQILSGGGGNGGVWMCGCHTHTSKEVRWMEGGKGGRGKGMDGPRKPITGRGPCGLRKGNWRKGGEREMIKYVENSLRERDRPRERRVLDKERYFPHTRGFFSLFSSWFFLYFILDKRAKNTPKKKKRQQDRTGE